MKILSLNIECGKYLADIINYVTIKTDIDIFLLQEVAGGYRYKLQYQKPGFDINSFENIDCFQELKKLLGKKYIGYLIKSYFDETEKNYLGNALFISKKIQTTCYEEKILGGNRLIDISEKSLSQVGYTIQHIKLTKLDLDIYNTHIIKFEVDKELASKYFEVVKSTIKYSRKFILGGDFNVDYKNSLFKKTFKEFLVINEIFSIKNTLNKNLHRLFYNEPHSKGLSVDNFVSSVNITPINMIVECNRISDHCPIIFEFKVDE